MQVEFLAYWLYFYICKLFLVALKLYLEACCDAAVKFRQSCISQTCTPSAESPRIREAARSAAALRLGVPFEQDILYMFV